MPMNRIIRNLLQGAPGTVIPIASAPPPMQGRQANSNARPQDIMSDDSRKLFAAWQAWRGDRLLPRRADMDLVSISRLMPRLGLVDVRSAEQVTFRLAGTEIEQQFGQRLTGRSYLRLGPPERQKQHGELLWRIATQPCAMLQHISIDWQSGRRCVLEMLALPMLPDRDGDPVQLLGVVSRLPQRSWGETDRIVTLHSIMLRLIDIGAGLPAGRPGDPPAD